MTDYTDLIARLLDEAQYNGPLYAEAADALEAQARRIAGYQKDADDYLIRLDELNALRDRIDELERMLAVHRLAVDVDALKARIAELTAALREAYEVYAGSDGFIPETAAEGYQQQLIKQMVDIIGAALAKENADIRAARAALEKK